jgi:hypothetical protein
MVSKLHWRVSRVLKGSGESSEAPFVRVVDASQRDVLLIFEETVEVGMVSVELQLGKDKRHIGADQRAVSCISDREHPVCVSVDRTLRTHLERHLLQQFSRTSRAIQFDSVLL